MKTIKLKSNGIGRYDDVSPFIVIDNKLELNIQLPNFNGEFCLVAENNGKVIKRLLSRNESVILEELTAGELKAEVKHYLKGELIKTYTVEPLILQEVDGSLSAEPEIAEMQGKLARLINSFGSYATATEAKIAKLESKIFSLIKFALKDYKNNVYLDGGDVEKFITEFSLELDEKEINLIKGEEENVD